MSRTVYGDGFKNARATAFARSGGLCQLCGMRAAVEAHHWQLEYSDDRSIRPDHLTALCGQCHSLATLFRRATRRGISFHSFMQHLGEVIANADSS